MPRGLCTEGLLAIIWFQFNLLYATMRGLFRLTGSSDLLGTFGGASVCISAYGGRKVLELSSFSSCFNSISIFCFSVVTLRSLLITNCCFLFLTLKRTTRMMTPTTMTTSMITTVTTIMTDVVVAPSIGRLVAGCVLLLTGTVLVVLIVSSLLVGCILLLAMAVSVIVITPLMVGCMLLLTGTVLVVVIVPSLLVGCILLMARAV